MRKSSLILAVMLAASAGGAGWLWTELQAERDRNAELQVQLAAAQAGAAPAPGDPPPPAPFPGAVGAEPPPPTSLPAPSNSITPQASAKPPLVEGEEQLLRRLMRDPRYRAMWREQQRLAYTPRRENLVRLVGLTPQQADAVIQMQIDRDVALMEKTPADMAADDAALQDRLRKLLGEDRRARVQEYMDTRGTRMQVDSFRTELTEMEALRDDQIEPLITALHGERSQFRQEVDSYRATLDWEHNPDAGRQFNERQLEMIGELNSRMVRAAAAVLSQAQLKKLEAKLQREFERQKASVQMSQLRAKIDGKSGQ